MPRLNLDILLRTLQVDRHAYGLATITNSPAGSVVDSMPFSIKDLVFAVTGKMEEDQGAFTSIDLDTNANAANLHRATQTIRTSAAESAIGLPSGLNREKMEEVGSILFNVIFPKNHPTTLCLKNSISYAEGTGCKIRIRLRVTDELAALPWEWMYDEGTNQFLILDSNIPIIRYRGRTRVRDDNAEAAPINILIVVANPVDQTSVRNLAAETEMNLQETFRNLAANDAIRIEWIRDADTLKNWRKLQNTGFQPHIVLIISHGETDKKDNYLIFEDSARRSHKVSFAGISKFFLGNKEIGLVVLAGCELGTIPDGQRAVHLDIGGRLVDEGVPNVISMKFLVRMTTMSAFCDELFATLVRNESIDDALLSAIATVAYGPKFTDFGNFSLISGMESEYLPFRFPPIHLLAAHADAVVPAIGKRADKHERPAVPIATDDVVSQAPLALDESYVDVAADPKEKPFSPGLTASQIERIIQPYPHVRGLREGLVNHLARPLPQPLDRFFIGRYPVTNEQFAKFVDATGHKTTAERDRAGAGRYWRDFAGSGYGDCPVVCISYLDAMAYCTWRSQIENRHITLPRPEQWEKAARGWNEPNYPNGRVYPWGDIFDPEKCYTAEVAQEERTVPVTRYSQVDSPYGAKDLVGNAAEWTLSPGNNMAYVLGGSWRMTCELYGLPSMRTQAQTSVYRDDIGFRCMHS